VSSAHWSRGESSSGKGQAATRSEQATDAVGRLIVLESRYFQYLRMENILARIDRAILDGYLKIVYDYRLPVLVFTDDGWEIEKETFAIELLAGFDKLLSTSQPPYDMSYLKDRNRTLVWRLLDKIEASGNPKYLPLLEAWAETDYKKVKQQIEQVMHKIKGAG